MLPTQKDLPVKVGDIIAAKYHVEKVIGVGGMGAVVAARHEDLGELRAIKFMLPAASQDEGAVERFLREARAAVRLKSEHVARILDVGRFPSGEPYIVMEHLDGHDLKREFRIRGPLPPSDVADYIVQAIEALAEAHRAGIVHRDLKPANLFLTTRNDGRSQIKVLDFGISKLTGELAKTSGDLTGTSALLGSPHYMSPEQMTSSRDIDARADIWGLGVILYELLTGKRPFAGETITAIAVSVTSDVPEPLTAIRAGIPDGLAAVVMRCLRKDPAQRYDDVAALATALAPFTSDEWRSLVAQIERVQSSSVDEETVESAAASASLGAVAESEPPTAIWDAVSGGPMLPAPESASSPSLPSASAAASPGAVPPGPAASSDAVIPGASASLGSGSWTGSGSLGTQAAFELALMRNRSTLVVAVAGAVGVVGLVLVLALISGGDSPGTDAPAAGAASSPPAGFVAEPLAPAAAVEATAEIEIVEAEPAASASASASAKADIAKPKKPGSGTKEKRPVRAKSGHDPFGKSWR